VKVRIDSLDRLFSEYIRMLAYKDGKAICAKCGGEYYDTVRNDGTMMPGWRLLQCSHFHGRGCQSVRFDEDNTAAICFGCHLYLGSRPVEHRKFFIERLGQEGFDMLEARKQMSGKPDREAIRLYLKEKIKELRQ